MLAFICLSCTKSKNAGAGVCDTWPTAANAAQSTRALDRTVDSFARSLDPQLPLPANARAIAEWLEKQPCIEQVGIATDVVTTEPPGLDLTVRHRNGSKRTFSMLFGKDYVKLSNSC
ncbi:hypothetical protein [Hymenobacter roseosalivarius]|uniref:hypothetical protein n=1 Tax=Hymenobacter roseosalivarius TaxID=89967 RepID=UPI000A06FE8C|nr:hypothetical protein [Hymenobacter roseosalivarius]